MIDAFLQLVLVFLVALLGPRRPASGEGEAVTLADGSRIRLERRGPPSARPPGEPAYVLMSGLSGGVEGLAEIQAALATDAQTLAYDRGGIGLSSPPLDGEPRDARQIAAELGEVLAKSGVEGPYVLVAHSIAGLYARVFAQEHPELVRAVVLLDPLMEDEWDRVSAASRAGDETFFFRSLPLEILLSLGRGRAAPWDAAHWLGAWREARGVYTAFDQVRAAPLTPGPRVVVVSAGTGLPLARDPAVISNDLRIVQGLHRDLAAASGGRHEILPEADHNTLLEAPHATLVAALARAAAMNP